MAFILVLNGPLRARTIPVKGPRFVLGRRDGCHLAIPDGRVSREHAVLLEIGPGRFRVQDLESENGVFVNGNTCAEQDLRHDDVLRIGRTELRFLEHAADEEERSWPDAAHETPPAGESTRTEGDFPPDPKDPRTDHRERIRRLERQLLLQESDNARLAAENAQLNREVARLECAFEAVRRELRPAVEIPFPSPSGACLSWPEAPDASAHALLVRGGDGRGEAFEVEARHRLRAPDPGSPRRTLELRACGLGELPRLAGHLQELTRSDRRARGLLVALDDASADPGALAPLAGRVGGPAFVLDMERLTALAAEGWQKAPVEARAVALVEALAGIAEPAFQDLLAGSGVLSLGIAGAPGIAEADLPELLRVALSTGWLGGPLEPERGRELALLAVIGSGVPRAERAAPTTRESLTQAARRVLPGVDVTVAMTSGPGTGLRLVALLGGLAVPAPEEERMP